MIDIHAHILPELDDGPTCLDHAVKYVKQAYNEGITTILATPHAMDGIYQCTPQQIISKCTLLTQELEKRNIAVNIRPGSEIHLTHDTVSLYDKGRLMTLNNLDKHILLELPPVFIVDGVIHVIKQLAERRIVSIIAHPERNVTLMKHLNIIPELLDVGALMQITAMSLMGGFGKRIRSISEKMIKNDVVRFVSSDIHPGRKYMMREAYEKISSLVDTNAAEKIFRKNPGKILHYTS